MLIEFLKKFYISFILKLLTNFCTYTINKVKKYKKVYLNYYSTCIKYKAFIRNDLVLILQNNC